MSAKHYRKGWEFSAEAAFKGKRQTAAARRVAKKVAGKAARRDGKKSVGQ